MVVYTVTYAFTNPTSGFNSTNYSTGTVYLYNIKSNNLHVKSNIILSDSPGQGNKVQVLNYKIISQHQISCIKIKYYQILLHGLGSKVQVLYSTIDY